jgi:hypothetical protein
MDEYYPDPDAPPRPPPPSSAPRTRAGATVAYGDPARTTVVVLPSARAPQTPPPSVPSQQIPTGLPVGQARPAYLGATRGHERQIVSCERCGHSGPADVVKVRGAASCFAGILTFGLSACCCGDAFSDTYHHCANCSAVLAFAKLA